MTPFCLCQPTASTTHLLINKTMVLYSKYSSTINLADPNTSITNRLNTSQIIAIIYKLESLYEVQSIRQLIPLHASRYNRFSSPIITCTQDQCNNLSLNNLDYNKPYVDMMVVILPSPLSALETSASNL